MEPLLNIFFFFFLSRKMDLVGSQTRTQKVNSAQSRPDSAGRNQEEEDGERKGKERVGGKKCFTPGS